MITFGMFWVESRDVIISLRFWIWSRDIINFSEVLVECRDGHNPDMLYVVSI
jgi:hypothetical protein